MKAAAIKQMAQGNATYIFNQINSALIAMGKAACKAAMEGVSFHEVIPFTTIDRNRSMVKRLKK